MATQGFQSPFLAPDLLKKQYQMQQNQRYAQMLMEQGAEQPQGQMVGNHYVAPSITQHLANALKTYTGRKLADDLPNQQAGLQHAQQAQMQNMFGLGGDSSNSPAQAMAVGAQQGSVGPTNDNAQRLGAALGGQSMVPLLPGRSAQESYLTAASVGMPEYMKLVAQQGTPTDIQKNLIAQGIQPGSPQWNEALGGVTEKAGYIAPISAAPGSTLVDPRTGRPTFNAPDQGRQIKYDAQGNPTVQQVPGWNEAETAQAQAQAAGQAAGKVTGEYAGKQLTGEKRREAVRAASGIDASAAQLGRLKETVDLLKNHPGFEGITGLSVDRLSSLVPGTDAADAAAQFTVLKSQIAQNVLQMYRQMSETGGAVGQVSDNEQKLFQNNLAALSTMQSPEEMKKSLDRITKFVDDSTGRLKSAFDKEYGAGTFNSIMGEPDEPQEAVADGAIPRVTNQAQLQSLPSGSLFIAPDGTTRRVP